jgi:hypothetical protein
MSVGVPAIEWNGCEMEAALAMIGTREGETNSTRRDQVYFISYPAGRHVV